jgi:Ca2+-binding RTX toxin-like protein
LGNDKLTGGDGNDAFVFNTALNGTNNVDSIGDFDPLEDVIRIDNAVFNGLATGTLASAAFAKNATGNAGDASDRIIYETDTGNCISMRTATAQARRFCSRSSTLAWG